MRFLITVTAYVLLLLISAYPLSYSQIVTARIRDEVSTTTSSKAKASSGAVKNTEDETKFKLVKITVQGNVYVPTESIIKASELKAGSVVTKAEISKAISRIYDMGYFTDINVRLVPTGDGYQLIINVVENPVIRKIVFIGNRLLSKGELLELMDTRPGKLLNFKVLREDLKRINEEYNFMGLIGVPNHVEDINFADDGTLYIKIREGFLIKKLVVDGYTVVPREKVMACVKLRRGDYLRRDALERTLKAISRLYRDEGYLLVDIRVTPEGDGTLRIRLVEGVLEGIEVEGLKKTKPYVVKEQVELPVGEVVNLNYLKRSIRKLSFSGLFKNVSVDFKAGSKPGRVILVVKVVEEPKTGQLVLSAALSGASGSNRGGLAGALSVSELNYRGKGQKVFIQWQQGEYIRQFNFSFWDPYSAPGNVIWGFSYFDTKYTYQRVPIPNSNPLQWAYYTDRRKGASVSYGRRNVRRRTRWLLTLSRYSVNTTPDPSAPPSVTAYMISGTIGSLTLSYTHDTRDDEFMPTRGSYETYSLEHATKLLGDFTYTKAQVELRRYWRVGRRNVIAARLIAGWASDNVPITSMFVMGGADTLRAYPYNSFIGNKAFLTSLEYRFPLSKKEESQFYGAIFVDYGKTFLPQENFSFSDMKLDYGVGVLFTMPTFGLIRVDYAMSRDDRRVVIRVGQTF